jgi:hypothetical protein
MSETGFSLGDIQSLSNLLNGTENDDVDENQFYSNETKSTLNPGNINGKEKKEIAPPNTKIEAKYNHRILTKPKNEIWTEKDFKEEKFEEDDRPKPKFEILYKQNVGTEDIYLGLSDKDISSNSCDQLLMKVYLPNTNLKEIGLEVKEQSVHLTTPQYLLNHILQYKVFKDKTEAKWDKNKGLLLLTFFIKKKNILDELVGEEKK